MELGNILDIKTDIKAEEGDYLQDGLLYCGKCNTPKQAKVRILDEIKTPFCLCKCASERLKAEEQELKRLEREKEINKNRSIGSVDKDLLKCTFENDDRANERLTDLAQRYTNNFSLMREKGKGLLLFGGVGAGKTFISCCIANKLIDKGYSVLVTNFARIVNTLQGMYDGKQDYIDGLNKFSLLVIDDLASERDTEYMGEIIQNVIDARYRAGLPIIITTNLTGDELKHPQDLRKQRIYSRLFEMCIPYEVTGKDRRKEKLRDDMRQYKDILGL